MKGPSIAVLLGKPKGGSGEDEDAEDSSYKGASVDEYRSYLETAFPKEDWSDDERVNAMKEFVMACTE